MTAALQAIESTFNYQEQQVKNIGQNIASLQLYLTQGVIVMQPTEEKKSMSRH